MSTTSYMAKPGEFPRSWWLVDANGLILGRLASKLARLLMGKTKPTWTPHIDTGDFVVVVNSSKVAVTGDKLKSKEYQTFSGYPHGQKRKPLAEMLAKRPDEVIRLAVKRMLPKSRLGRKMLLKLKIHDALPKHAYKAQQPKPLALEETKAKAAS